MNRLLTLIALLLSLSACQAPREEISFVRSEDSDGGVYKFVLDLKDTTATYNISLYSRAASETLDNVELTISWEAPSGHTFTETVYLPRVSTKACKELYRSDMVPGEYGEWQLAIRPKCDASQLLGIGVILEL